MVSQKIIPQFVHHNITIVNVKTNSTNKDLTTKVSNIEQMSSPANTNPNPLLWLIPSKVHPTHQRIPQKQHTVPQICHIFNRTIPPFFPRFLPFSPCTLMLPFHRIPQQLWTSPTYHQINPSSIHPDRRIYTSPIQIWKHRLQVLVQPVSLCIPLLPNKN